MFLGISSKQFKTNISRYGDIAAIPFLHDLSENPLGKYIDAFLPRRTHIGLLFHCAISTLIYTLQERVYNKNKEDPPI